MVEELVDNTVKISVKFAHRGTKGKGWTSRESQGHSIEKVREGMTVWIVTKGAVLLE